MSFQPLYDACRFALKRVEVFGLVGVVVAGQWKFLPDHHSELVAELEELVLVDRRAAPHTEDVHVSFKRESAERAVGIDVYLRIEDIRADEVRTFGEDAAVVDFKRERAGSLRSGRRRVPAALVHDELDAAEADFLCIFVDLIIAGDERDAQGIQVLVALTRRPPELRLAQCQLGQCVDIAVARKRQLARGDDFAVRVDELAYELIRDTDDSGFDRQFDKVERVSERIVELDVSQTIIRAVIEYDLARDSGGDEPRVPVPAVGYRRLDRLASLIARIGRARYLGHGVDYDLELDRAALEFGERQHDRSEHSLAVGENFSVRADGVAVVEIR